MKIDREAPIGVFDSGVGGLTVAREITPMMGMSNSSLTASRANALAVLHATTIAFTCCC